MKIVREKRTPTPLVNTFIVGVQKSGTRALRNYLLKHPDIYFGEGKLIIEPHFFDNDTLFHDSPNYDRYHQIFPSGKNYRLVGDITPNYIYWAGAIKRIYEYNCNAKIIVLIRDPVERALSQWVMQYKKQQEKNGFLMALLKEQVYKLFFGQHRNYSYLQRGFYRSQLKRLNYYFPKGQCLVLKTDDLLHHYEETLTKTYSFLGVKPIKVPKPELVHKNNYHPMNATLRKFLIYIYRRDIKYIENEFEWDCANWLE